MRLLKLFLAFVFAWAFIFVPAKVSAEATTVMEDAVAKYPGKTIFIGAHSFINAVVLCSVLGLDTQHFPQIAQNNTCVNVLQYEDGLWKIVTMNSMAHLGKLTM